MRVLIVEDNVRLRGLIAEGLAAQGFESDGAEGLAHARDALGASSYAALIVDLGLPDGDGRTLVSNLRAQGNPTPILMLTARAGLEDRVSGLNCGADDYLTKPFAFPELIARMQALLRRQSEYLGNRLKAGNVTFDSVARQIFVNDTPRFFSAREMSLLEILIRRPGRVVPKRLVEDHLFGLSQELRSNAVEVYVHRLRKHLAESGANTEVHTVRGVGYILVEQMP